MLVVVHLQKGSKTFITQTPDMTFALFTNETVRNYYYSCYRHTDMLDIVIIYI